MPPCPPENNISTAGDDVLKDVTTDTSSTLKEDVFNKMTNKTSTEPSKSSRSFFTIQAPFHLEMNFYSITALTFLYLILSPAYRVYMKMVFALVAIDASRYYYMKGSMSGVPYTFPFVTIIAMLVQPERFWAEMADVAISSKDGMCTSQLVGKFLVFVTDPKLCRQILTGEGVYGIYAHPNSKYLFGEKNLIYLETDPHKYVRKILTPALFSNEALSYYAKCQEKVVTKFLQKYSKQCEETGKPIDLRIAFRSMAAAASQESFLGPYLDDELREKLEQDIFEFTMGFLSIPIPYIGGLKKAIEAKHRIEEVVQTMVPKAKQYILEGNKPRCMLDRWAVSIFETAKKDGVNPDDIYGCNDDDIGRTVLDFLFAAQDATNSALTYTADVLAAHPDVMEKMAQEITATFGDDPKDIWTRLYTEPDCIPYTQRVSNQMLHHKPPVPMIPHISKKASYLNEHYIPKGAVVIPSLFYAARESGSSIEFLPDREDQDSQFIKCMTFGGGQHKCPGRRYAETLLTVFLAQVATKYRFERVGDRPGQDDFIYFPTLFPLRNDYYLKSI